MNPSPVFRRFNGKELKNVSVHINSYLKKSSPRLHSLTQTISSIKQCAFSLQRYSSSGVHVPANHENLSSKTQNNLMIVRTISEGVPEDARKSECYALYRDDENFTKYADLDFPFTHPYRDHFRIIGNINGVLCITGDMLSILHDTYLWNPSIRKFVQLPLPKYTYESYGAFEQELGFGYDAKTNDYKVVRLVQLDDTPEPFKVELYSVSTGVWKDISDIGLEFRLRGRSRQAYCNGAAHWVPFRPNGWIVYFDFSEEVFGCFKTPVGDSDYFSRPWPLVVEDSLCLVDGRMIWKMEEYGNDKSWVKWWDGSLSTGRLIGFRKEGEVLLEIDGKLHSFDRKKAQGKKMNILTGFSLEMWNKIQQGLLTRKSRIEFKIGDDEPFSCDLPTDVLNYDPDAAPKDLGIESNVDGDSRYSLYCDAYVESLALADQGESVESLALADQGESEEEGEGSSSSI